jgi:catechol 2,3-dioxygenase-like lactoylglutathione lyase family enzyme
VSIRRIVPDIKSKNLEASRRFYVDVLGLEVAMDLGFIVTLISPTNPTAQLSVMQVGDPAAIMPHVSIDVADVDAVHARAVAQNLQIVYPLTNEPWGVRRFFLVDPDGTILNVLSHIGSETSAVGG